MVEYGVITTNKFHFLSDDEDADPSQILAKAAEIKKAKGTSINKLPQKIEPTSNLAAPKPEKPKTENAERRPPRDGNRGAGRGRGRGDRITGSGGQEERRPHREGQDERRPPRDGQDERRPPRDGNRGAGRGRGRGDRIGGAGGQEDRRPHREGQEDRRPHREGQEERRPHREGQDERRPPREGQEERRPYREGQEERRPYRDGQDDRRPPRGNGRGRGGNRGDRISGSDRTGVRGESKKEGHGKGNWGTEKDELQGETEPIAAVETTEKPAHGEEDNADKNDSGVEVEKEEEEKPVGITFSEWKEKNKAVEIESFNVRKPNEDKKLNLAPLKKEEDAGKDNEEFVVLRREPREKHVDISVNFAQTNDRGARDGFSRGRDGFRGGRGRGGRGERTGGGNRSGNFNLNTEQFPALGGR